MSSDFNPSRHDHLQANRQAFTRQAQAYATSPVITNEERVARLVSVVSPSPGETILEVACGPGHVSLALAPATGWVTGIDLTEAPVQIARQNAAERGIGNADFRVADAYELPFEDERFDAAVSRYAFHHMEYPLRALREISRCCRRGARIVLEDMYGSETPARSSYHDRMEILRDPSHRRALPLSEMITLFALSGIEVEFVGTGTILQDGEQWLSEMGTPDERAGEIRALLQRDAVEDLSILSPFQAPDGRLCFTHRTVIVAGRKL